MSQPVDLLVWPLAVVLRKLASAVEHLLDDHSCDHRAHEEWRTCVTAAREHAQLTDTAARLAAGPSWRKPEPLGARALVLWSEEDYETLKRTWHGEEGAIVARGRFVRLDDTLCFEKRDEDTEWWLRPSLHDLLDREKIVLRQGGCVRQSCARCDRGAEAAHHGRHRGHIGLVDQDT